MQTTLEKRMICYIIPGPRPKCTKAVKVIAAWIMEGSDPDVRSKEGNEAGDRDSVLPTSAAHCTSLSVNALLGPRGAYATCKENPKLLG
jgi:hypothetical protein